jgi:membrane-bound serine protease (ClpP class)
MEAIILNPNVAYLILVSGFLMAILAVMSPGTGIFEIAALTLLTLAGWAMYNLPINYWALAVLILGVFPFLLAVRKSRRLVYLVIAIATLVLGSAFLFQGEGLRPAVEPLLALVASTLVSGFMWIVVTKTLDAIQVKPEHDLSRLIGAIGEAKTDIGPEGSVQVESELWSANSEQPIQAGAAVRVIGREGFTLKVERTEGNQPASAPGGDVG